MLRHPSLLSLSREHHHALVLAKRAARAAEADSSEQLAMCRLLADSFAAELNPHFLCEERDLPSKLTSAEDLALLAQMHDDHASLRQLAAGLARGETQYLAEFAGQLAAHVRFEERELFPAVEQNLPPADGSR